MIMIGTITDDVPAMIQLDGSTTAVPCFAHGRVAIGDRVVCTLVGKQLYVIGRQDNADPAHIVGAVGEPAFQNSWVAYGGVYQVPRFWKDADDNVHLEGMAKGGTPSSTSVIFTLPVGYRPGATLIVPAIAVNEFAHMRIANNGQVTAYGTDAAWVTTSYFSITVPSFRAEA